MENKLKFNEYYCKSRKEFNISITINDKNQELMSLKTEQ